MQIQLPHEVPVVETIVQETARATADLEFVYADFKLGKVTLKIQPWNKEVIIAGQDYENMRGQFEAALAAAFGPAVEAALAPLIPAPAPEEGGE